MPVSAFFSQELGIYFNINIGEAGECFIYEQVFLTGVS